MFRVQPAKSRDYRVAIIGLLALSVTSLGITLWVMAEFRNEQAIIQQLIRDLPARDLPAAETLAGNLHWLFRIAVLFVIKTEVSRVGSVLEGFRDFASVGRLHREPVDIHEQIDQQARLIRPRAQQFGILLNVLPCDTTRHPLFVEC